MPNYDGATFEVAPGSWSRWERKSYGDAGQGAPTLSVRAIIRSLEDFHKLRAMAGESAPGRARTLSDLEGKTYDKTFLLRMRNPRRRSDQPLWMCDLEFIRDTE